MDVKCPACESTDVWVDVAGLTPVWMDSGKVTTDYDDATLTVVDPGFGTCGACEYEGALDLFMEVDDAT